MGLFLEPPEHALVLCGDEKTQIKALDRTQPGLPLKRGRGTTLTRDDKRNRVPRLFAALNVLTVMSMTDQLHRHEQWLRLLETVDRKTPQRHELDLIVDPDAPHGQTRHPSRRELSLRWRLLETLQRLNSGPPICETIDLQQLWHVWRERQVEGNRSEVQIRNAQFSGNER